QRPDGRRIPARAPVLATGAGFGSSLSSPNPQKNGKNHCQRINSLIPIKQDFAYLSRRRVRRLSWRIRRRGGLVSGDTWGLSVIMSGIRVNGKEACGDALWRTLR